MVAWMLQLLIRSGHQPGARLRTALPFGIFLTCRLDECIPPA